MEENEESCNERSNGLTKLILKENTIITVLDLSNSNLKSVDNICFPPNLVELNLSNNELEYVPMPVLNLTNIKVLNLSTNSIKVFDETPSFCHTIEKLNLAENNLRGPPYWIWCEYPKNLKELDISNNRNIRNSLTEAYLRELLQFKTTLSVIKMRSCAMNSHYELLETFANAKVIDVSSTKLINANCISNIPCKGLDKCCNVERLNLRYTHLSLVNPNIDLYNNLIEINLSENKISSLPNEFCNLNNLEVCILSFNNIMYLPDNIVKLKKLVVFSVDNNMLCMLPEFYDLENLVKLDVYDNYLYEAPKYSERVKELDLAQNYFDEPVDEEYGVKKSLLRTELVGRIDGRKYEIEKPESIHSSNSLEDFSDIDYNKSIEVASDRPLSSPEDWDSDEHWVPHFSRATARPQSPWIFYVQQKMAQGNFCPMDAHTVSVAEKVQYEKLSNPPLLQVSDGQFDDYSSDDSP